MAVDPYVNVPSYDKQLGKILELAAGANIEVQGSALPMQVVISNAAGGTQYYSLITLQVQDNSGNNLAGVFELSFWLSDSSVGAGLTATTASGGVTVTTGTQIQAKVAAKAFDIITNSSGQAVVQIIDSAKTGFYPITEAPGTGLLIVGAQLTTASYHA